MMAAIQLEDEIQKATEPLLEAIRESQAYRDFELARAELGKYPDKKDRANQFRRQNFIAKNYSAEDSARERAELYRQRQQLRLDPVIDHYLNAELILCRMLRGCAMQILDCAQLDLENMDDIL